MFIFTHFSKSTRFHCFSLQSCLTNCSIMKRSRRSAKSSKALATRSRVASPTSGSSSSSSESVEEAKESKLLTSKYFSKNLANTKVNKTKNESDHEVSTRSSAKKKVKVESSSEDVVDIEDCADDMVNLFTFRGQKYKLPWMPKDFQQTWDNIDRMREQETAPVDTMGCSQCHDPEEEDDRVRRLQSLVALILSSQTRDEINFQAMKRLKKRHLTVQWLLNIDESALASLIKPVSFHNQKAKYLKKVAKILREQYDDDIPNTVEGLCELPGVGPKMAHLTMKCAWDQVTGIAVDTHVHRIVNRLRWVKKETKTPEQTMKELESWLPKDLWFEINENLVGFGQTICFSRNPKCDQCLNRPLCPYAKKSSKRPKNSAS